MHRSHRTLLLFGSPARCYGGTLTGDRYMNLGGSLWLDWVTFRALRFATLPHDDLNLTNFENELASVSRTLGWVNDWKDTCITELGLTLKDFNVERTVAEIARALEDAAADLRAANG